MNLDKKPIDIWSEVGESNAGSSAGVGVELPLLLTAWHSHFLASVCIFPNMILMS